MSDTAAAPTKQALAALIARLEAATEGNRELDFAIAREIGWQFSNVLLWTTSVDAARTLVPERWDWALSVIVRDHLPNALISAQVANARTGIVDLHELCDAEGSTPALALCIAALKARRA